MSSRRRGRFHQSRMSFSVTNSRIVFQITQGAVSIRKTILLGMAIPMLKIRRPTGRLIFNMGIPIPGKTVFYIETGPRSWHFRHDRNTKSDSGQWSYRPVNCICSKKYTAHHGSFRFSAGLKRVWRDIRDSRNGGHCLLTVGGWLRGAKIGAECVKYVWLSCPAQLSGWVMCISMQWLRLKACHVACDEYASGEICSLQHMWVTGSVMWAVAIGASLKFGVPGASATNWFSRVNGARDNGIGLYMQAMGVFSD